MTKAQLDQAVAEGKVVSVELNAEGKVPEGASGDIGFVTDKVETEVKADGKSRKEARPYLKLVALTLKGATFLSEAKSEVLLGHFNYAYDLGARNRERQALLASLEGPEKAIERAIKPLLAAGVPEAVARKIVTDAVMAARAEASATEAEDGTSAEGTEAETSA